MSNNSSTPTSEPAGPAHDFGEDNDLAAEIAQQDWYDDSTSPHNTERMGAREWSAPTSVEGLSPEMRAPIIKQLAGLTPEQREQREPQLIREALEANSRHVRVLTGLGANATPYAKAMVNLSARIWAAEDRIADWQGKLDEVTGTRSVTDPATGQAVMQPVYRLSPEARHKAQEQVTLLKAELSALKGGAGDRELKEAMTETIAQVKERRQQAADLAEVDRRARESLREEELNARAALHAKHLRSTSNYSASL